VQGKNRFGPTKLPLGNKKKLNAAHIIRQLMVEEGFPHLFIGIGEAIEIGLGL